MPLADVTEQVDGATSRFELGPYVAGSARVYVRGLLLGSAEYVEDGEAVVLTTTPREGEHVAVRIQR